MEDKYPYETFYSKNFDIIARDNYTCQICDYYGVQKDLLKVTRCLECEKQGFEFQPFPDWSIPKPCREKGLKFRVCGECPQLEEISKEYVSYPNLTVHHKDGNKKNQSPENLVTVCTSCHRRLHPRGKILTIEEVKQKLKKERSS